MENKICANCKFFKMGRFEHSVVGNNLKETNNPKDGICLHPKVGSDYKNGWMGLDIDLPKDGIYASCDEERGELYVGENFGCIHFEGRFVIAKKEYNVQQH
jgi:hypothetical protein